MNLTRGGRFMKGIKGRFFNSTSFRNTFKENVTGYMFMAPMIIGLLLFIAYPLIESMRTSMFAIQIGTIETAVEKFVGLANIERAFKDPVFIKAMINTFKMAGYTLLLTVPGSFIVASMINKTALGRTFFKVTYYFPNVTSIVIVSVMFKYIFYSTDQAIEGRIRAQ